jgi:hypothetical protein
MKNIDTIPDEETLPTEQRLTQRAPARIRPTPPVELPQSPRRSAAAAGLTERLKRLRFRGRFSEVVDLKLLAAIWAGDYANHVFPKMEDDQTIRVLLAAEAGFLAATEMSKNGIRHWERLLDEARCAKVEFRLK